MKAEYKDETLTLQLLRPEITRLEKAREIGIGLMMMGQATGQPLVEAIDVILKRETPLLDDEGEMEG